MTSRFSLAPWLVGLTAATALVGCPGGGTVDIEFKQHYHLGETKTDTLVQPVGVPIEIWGMVGGTFRSVDLKNRGGGLLQGVDVPEGTLYYRNGARWIVTDAQAVLWQSHVWGRQDQVDTPEGTTVQTTLTGLVPWSQAEGATHQFNVWASGSGYAFPVPNASVTAGAEGASITLRDLKHEVDGVDTFLPALLGEKGDSLHIAQVLNERIQDVNGTASFEADRLSAVVRGVVVKGDALSFPDGVTNNNLQPTLAASLADGTVRTLDVNLNGNGYDAVISDAGGTVAGVEAVSRVLVRPDVLGGQALRVAGNFPFAVSANARTPVSGAPAARFRWSEAATAGAGPLQFAFSRSYDSNGSMVEAGTVTALDAAATSLDPAPLVGAPGAIHLEGTEVTAQTHITAASPLVTWSAPTIGTAHGYEVRLVRLQTDGTSISEALLTRDTQVRLPPAFLRQDEDATFRFLLLVTALHDAAEGFPETRQVPEIPFGFAGRATPVFTAGPR